jgi:hypothetical protein
LQHALRRLLTTPVEVREWGDSSPPGSEVKRLQREISECRTELLIEGELSVRLIEILRKESMT